MWPKISDSRRTITFLCRKFPMTTNSFLNCRKIITLSSQAYKTHSIPFYQFIFFYYFKSLLENISKKRKILYTPLWETRRHQLKAFQTNSWCTSLLKSSTKLKRPRAHIWANVNIASLIDVHVYDVRKLILGFLDLRVCECVRSFIRVEQPSSVDDHDFFEARPNDERAFSISNRHANVYSQFMQID